MPWLGNSREKVLVGDVDCFGLQICLVACSSDRYIEILGRTLRLDDEFSLGQLIHAVPILTLGRV
jgi:hypothetical protein